jgi:hypothetical protein
MLLFLLFYIIFTSISKVLCLGIYAILPDDLFFAVIKPVLTFNEL